MVCPFFVILESVHRDDEEVINVKTNLLTIPYVGKNTKEDLIKIGITCVEDLVGKDADDLYLKDCDIKGYKEDRCQLYVFRMAIYYAEHPTCDKSTLKWWNFKDE